MSNSPKISVIVPIYGVEKFLRECVDSILSQTFKDIEVLLINDGSKDNCPAIIDEYATKDSRVIAIHKANSGYGATCNVGLNKAKGKYISIIEPDDYIDASMFEDLYNEAEKYGSDIVKSKFYDNLQAPTQQHTLEVAWDDEQIPQDKSFTIKECPIFLCNHPSIWSCLYRKEFLDKHNIRFVEAPGAGWTDNPFQVQTMCLAEKINYIAKPYYYWRRINVKESDDLKDWTLPFKRSDEIHAWLAEQKITDRDILGCLYQRELSYLVIVLDKEYSPNVKKQVNHQIKLMLNRMDKRILKNSPYVQPYSHKRYAQFKHPMRSEFHQIFKKYKQKIIRLKISKHEVSCTVWGKQWRWLFN